MIDTEVESAMRSNSGEKKKKETFKRKRGEGRRGKKAKRGEKKNPLRAAHNFFFFLKEENFRVRSPVYLGLPAPLSGAARGVGKGRPPFVSLRVLLCDITHSTLFGVLVVVLLFFFSFFFLVGLEGGLDFLFLLAGAEARPKRPVSILCRSPLKLL